MYGSHGYKVVFHRPFELFNGVVVEGEAIIEPNRARGGKKGEHYLSVKTSDGGAAYWKGYGLPSDVVDQVNAQMNNR